MASARDMLGRFGHRRSVRRGSLHAQGGRDVGRKPGLSYTHERDDPIGAPVPSKTSHRTATAPCPALCMGERYPDLNYSNKKWLELAASCRNRVVEGHKGQ